MAIELCMSTRRMQYRWRNTCLNDPLPEISYGLAIRGVMVNVTPYFELSTVNIHMFGSSHIAVKLIIRANVFVTSLGLTTVLRRHLGTFRTYWSSQSRAGDACVEGSVNRSSASTVLDSEVVEYLTTSCPVTCLMIVQHCMLARVVEYLCQRTSPNGTLITIPDGLRVHCENVNLFESVCH